MSAGTLAPLKPGPELPPPQPAIAAANKTIRNREVFNLSTQLAGFRSSAGHVAIHDSQFSDMPLSGPLSAFPNRRVEWTHGHSNCRFASFVSRSFQLDLPQPDLRRNTCCLKSMD